MSWADEPEQDRALVERGARLFSRVLVALVLLVLGALCWSVS